MHINIRTTKQIAENLCSLLRVEQLLHSHGVIHSLLELQDVRAVQKRSTEIAWKRNRLFRLELNLIRFGMDELKLQGAG